jgi:hypothetical protein
MLHLKLILVYMLSKMRRLICFGCLNFGRRSSLHMGMNINRLEGAGNISDCGNDLRFLRRISFKVF